MTFDDCFSKRAFEIPEVYPELVFKSNWSGSNKYVHSRASTEIAAKPCAVKLIDFDETYSGTSLIMTEIETLRDNFYFRILSISM